MARLSFRELLVDADLTDTFDVVRRQESISLQGRSLVQKTLFKRIVGVVTMGEPNGLQRNDDYQSNPRTITIVTNFTLRSESKNFQPDLIFWRGNNFVVIHIAPYVQFGPGFYEVECSSIDHVDEALLPDNFYPQLDFNRFQNSGYVTIL